jgi:hypothetical protein
MIPTYTRKANGQQYRYYVSQVVIDRAKTGSVTRVPAAAIERVVEEELVRRLSPTEQKRWKSSAHLDRAGRLQSLVASVIVREQEVEIRLAKEADRALADAGRGHGPEGADRVIKRTPPRKAA